LLNGDPLPGGPIHVAAKPIIPRCFGFMLPFLPLAHHAVMVGADWVKAMGLYVSSFDQTLTFQSLAKWALANTNYYTNLTHAPGIVTNHAPL
jgi:hypothetical protein